MTRAYTIILAFLTATVCSCDIHDQVGASCSDEYVYGVRVDLLCPGLNGIAEWSGTVELTAPGYTEELSVHATTEADRLVAYGAGERPGTYTLTVESSGYNTWQREGIPVSENVCHVDQVTVAVELEER